MGISQRLNTLIGVTFVVGGFMLAFLSINNLVEIMAYSNAPAQAYATYLTFLVIGVAVLFEGVRLIRFQFTTWLTWLVLAVQVPRIYIYDKIQYSCGLGLNISWDYPADYHVTAPLSCYVLNYAEGNIEYWGVNLLAAAFIILLATIKLQRKLKYGKV